MSIHNSGRALCVINSTLSTCSNCIGFCGTPWIPERSRPNHEIVCDETQLIERVFELLRVE